MCIKLKCFSVIALDERMHIIKDFNSLGTYDAQIIDLNLKEHEFMLPGNSYSKPIPIPTLKWKNLQVSQNIFYSYKGCFILLPDPPQTRFAVSRSSVGVHCSFFILLSSYIMKILGSEVSSKGRVR